MINTHMTFNSTLQAIYEALNNGPTSLGDPVKANSDDLAIRIYQHYKIINRVETKAEGYYFDGDGPYKSKWITPVSFAYSADPSNRTTSAPSNGLVKFVKAEYKT